LVWLLDGVSTDADGRWLVAAGANLEPGADGESIAPVGAGGTLLGERFREMTDCGGKPHAAEEDTR
jgi:hypothetical protein